MDGFICTLVQCISATLGPDVEIITSEQTKNNQISYPCLTLRHSSRKISPNIRIDDLFSTYKKGFMGIEEIARQISEAYNGMSGDTSGLEDLYSDPEKLKDKIIYRLINFERNSDMLGSCPHFRILDLAMIFCLSVSISGDETGTIRIDDKLASIIGMDADKLLSYALKNTPKIYAYSYEKLDELLLKIMDKKGVPEEMFPPFIGGDALHTPMSVLTNNHEYYGASSMLYPGVLEKIRDELNQDFYIIPSSVHEVIIVPSSHTDSMHLRDMLEDVNKTIVPPEEILSDNIYRYPNDFGPDTLGPFLSSF